MAISDRDTLDQTVCDPEITWTTGNVAEAFPGVFTELGITFTHDASERSFRRVFHALGVFSPRQLAIPPRIEDQFWSVFAGRAAANMTFFRWLAGLIPGTSATAVEQQLFGYVNPETVNHNTARRYPVIFAKAPRTLVTLPRRHDAMFADLRRWRLEQLRRVPGLGEAEALDVLADARQRFEDMMSLHSLVAFVSSGLADQLTAAVADLDLPGLEARVLSGVGSDERDVAADLWSLAHDRLPLEEFLDRHGYHGPDEGQLHSVTWREDPAPVLARLEGYRAVGLDDARSPQVRAAEQERVREAATAELLERSPRWRRGSLRLVVRLTARWLSLREQGKAGYLLTFDVGKAAARRLGELLTARGVIDDPADVFFLTFDELAARGEGPHQEAVTRRRALYTRRLAQRLPKSWVGLPEVIETATDTVERAPAGAVITGVAASAGVAEGRARVVRDPATTDLDDGDILVCEATDPSWVSLFLVAGAVVTDFGGMLSHGPIVARELGIPCVCGTENGSARIRDGQRIRVDGSQGTVEVVG